VREKITKTVNRGTSERSGVTEGLETADSVVAVLGFSSDWLWRRKVRKTISRVPLPHTHTHTHTHTHYCCINVSASPTGRTFDMSA
jgi:hypothetical protein